MRGLICVAFLVAAIGTSRAGDPTRVYRTIETDHFVIYYWVPNDAVAPRVAVVAERAHRTLAIALDHRPTEKTLIFLADDTDSANGQASVLPRNSIQLNATGPPGFSELDDHDDWLYGLVAHEYTHILHLDTFEGLPTIYNSIFGKTWAPNQIMPRWLIEGIAVYEESKRSAGGRNRGTRFDSFIRTARRGHEELRLDEVSGAPRRFPRGNAAYVYGSHFLRYIFDRFGDDTLRRMSHAAGAHAPPYAVNRQIATVVGRPFTELYGDWMLYLRDKYGMQQMAAERRGWKVGRPLTHSAEANLFPHYSADGKQLFWLESDGYSAARVRSVPVGATAEQARDVVQIESMGSFDVGADNSLIYEQGRRYRLEYSFSDLFRWDARTRQVVRLTTGKRARDPALSPDGRRIAFSKNERAESVLAVMEAQPGAVDRVVWRGAQFDQAYQPAWSPDGTRIAFSAWRRGGYRDILIVDAVNGQVTEVTRDRAIDMAPAWSADGQTVYFDSDRTGIANIFAYDIADQSLWQVTNVLGGTFAARPSPDGTRIAFENAVPAGGYDIYEMPIDRQTWLPAAQYIDDRPDPVVIRDDEVAVSPPRPYRPLETLAPRAWTLSVDSSNHTANIQTAGADAIGIHSYTLAVGLDGDHGETNVGASYGYAGLRPGIQIAGARTIATRAGWRIDGVGKPYREEVWSGTVALSIPFESRPGSTWTFSGNYNIDWARLVEPPAMQLDPNQRVPTHPPTDYAQAGAGLRIAYSRVRSSTFSLGPNRGFDVSASLRLDHPALGATYRGTTASYAGDVFQRLWGRSPVLAVRATGAVRAGDVARSGGFGLGGVPAQDIATSIVNSARSASTGYLRGYRPRTVAGNQFHLLNAEYRQELWQIERGLATLPLYLRRLHIGVLTDLGTAFDTAFDAASDLRWSVGAALRLDVQFGYFAPGTFEVGYAHGVIQGGIGETWLLLTGSL